MYCVPHENEDELKREDCVPWSEADCVPHENEDELKLVRLWLKLKPDCVPHENEDELKRKCPRYVATAIVYLMKMRMS